MHPVLALVALVALGAPVLPAAADIGPNPGYVETCTEEKKEQPGTDCEICVPGPDDQDDDSADDDGSAYSVRIFPSRNASTRSRRGSSWSSQISGTFQ